MPLDFPPSPSVNDTYSFGGKTWFWTGQAWKLVTFGAINDIPIGNVVASTGNFTTVTGASAIFSGNVAADYFTGNGSQLTGISTSTSEIFNGLSNVAIDSANADITMAVSGVSNVVVISTDGITVTGNVTANSFIGDGSQLTGIGTFAVSTLNFTGDGSTTQFIISSGYATDSVLVFENGVAQLPVTDYSVSGNVLTITSAPGAGVDVQVRLFQGGSGTGNVDLSAVDQNIVPAANITYDLGTTNNRWNDIWLANSTIYLGEASISASGAELILPAQVAIGNATIDGSSGGIALPANSTIGGAIVATPRIVSIDYPGDDTAADPAGGQTIGVVGSGFQNGASIIIDNVMVSVVTFVSDARLEFVSPAKAAGSYTLYVINPDGGTGIFVPGVQYSGVPTWQSPAAGSLGEIYETQSISNTFVATSDSAVVYSLQSGTLPPGSELNSSTGTLSGTANLTAGNPVTYNFTIRATDAELQDTDRSFSLTIDPDVITWVSPTDGGVVTVTANVASTTALEATSAAGSAIDYSANTLPTGLSLSGNVISGTATESGNTSVALTATGNATTRSSVITVTFVVQVGTDPYFNQTVLLLPGDGTNGAQNNTFLDSSSNNFSITRNGNTTQGTFSPFSLAAGEWSNYFDGSGDKLTAAANSAFQFGTGDFCIEFWFYPTSLSGFQTPIDMGYSASGSWGLQTGNGNGIPGFYTGGSILITSSTAWTLNSWNHVVVCRSSTTLSMFLNGSRTATASNSTNYNSNSSLGIGAAATASPDYPVVGYMASVRLVKGSAVYDPTSTTITVPTSPLTAIANTQLLTCQSNRFRDASINNFTITPNGDVRVTAFSPFAPTAVYDPAVNGGSGYYPTDTSGLRTTESSANVLGTDPFTCETWIYLDRPPAAVQNVGSTNNGGQVTLFGWAGSTGSLVAWRTFFSITSSTGSTWNQAWLRSQQNAGKSSVDALLSTPLAPNAWYHVAIVRPSSSSASLNVYINGVLNCTLDVSGANFTFGGSSTVATVGWTGLTSFEYSMRGFLSDARIIANSALYTSNFTPPTAPLTAITNTSLLCNFTNAGIIDNTGKNNLETVGNAQISTSVKKFGTGSIAFDGTGDYLVMPNNPELILAGGPWTIECWIYRTGGFSTFRAIVSKRASGSTTTSYQVYLQQTTGYLGFYNGTQYNSTYTPPENTWVHIAAVYTGTNIILFADGTSVLNTAVTVTEHNLPVVIGASLGYNLDFSGYIDDLRITKGIARYTANFTPPTEPFPGY